MNLAGYGGDIFLSPGQSCIAVISMEESKRKFPLFMFIMLSILMDNHPKDRLHILHINHF